MRVLDLFSGIGGFSLGLERAGMRTVAFCERDEYCRAVLRKHWPGVPCFDDVRAIDAGGLDRIGPVDLICGGFPCQPFSHAGKQRAQADDRHLWPSMREVIALARPAWVLAENVAGLIALALDDVLADLEALGYASRALVIPAVAVDAKHRRDRVWIIARDTNGDRQSALPEHGEVEELRSSPADAFGSELWDESGRRGRARGKGSAEPRDYGAEGAMADSGGHRLQGERDGRDPGQAALHGPWSASAGTGRSADADHSSMQRAAFVGDESDGAHDASRCAWLPEPGVGRVADGVPRRVDRLRCLGNAVVPQVVEEIGRAIMRCSV